jgi:hypothetical protein
MSEIISLSDAAQSIQRSAQNAISMQVMKQTAKAQQALADMLAENAKKAQTAQKQSSKGGISIYV